MFFWLYIIALIFTFSFAYACFRAAPWVPMHAKDVPRVMALARLSEGEVFFDLGAGDGRTIIAAAQAGAKAKGYEISLLPFFIAWGKILFSGQIKNSKMIFRDFWHVDLSRADIIFVFLMPKIRERLKEKIEREMKPGSRIITYVWPMIGWEADQIDVVEGRPKIYSYSIKGS